MTHAPATLIRAARLHRIKNSEVGPMAANSHEPVMLGEILDLFMLQPGSVVVDGTVGLGGHSMKFAERIRPGGTLIGLDWDSSMLQIARERLDALEGVRVVLVHNDFRNLKTVLDGMDLKADGILLDLGLNSAQVDDPGRGLSFLQDGPLDMRMDRSSGEPASALLNRASPAEIEQILFDLGDERWARAIARKIVELRRVKPLSRTGDLVEAVLQAIPPGAREKRIHPATRTFQAIRIVVNGELEGLDEALRDAAQSLNPHGVLAVLSYHSGEDRAVKRAFRELAGEQYVEMTKKPVTPSDAEVQRNPRSRSAKLRALQRR